MAAGFQTFTADGKLQLDSNTLMYGYVGKVSWTYTLDSAGRGFAFNSSLPEHQMAAISCSTLAVSMPKATPDYTDASNPNGLRTSIVLNTENGAPNSTHTFTVYMFKQYSLLPATNAGLTLHNDAGVRTFDAGYRPLKVAGAIPITSMTSTMDDFYAVSGGSTAFMLYGTVLREIYPPGPPAQSGDAVFTSIGFNAAVPAIRNVAGGFRIKNLGDHLQGYSWTAGNVFNGGVVVVDVTGY